MPIQRAVDRRLDFLIAHPLGAEICWTMLHEGLFTPKAIAGRLRKTLPTILQSLQALQTVGLMSSKKRGRERYYRPVDNELLTELLSHPIVKDILGQRRIARDRPLALARLIKSLTSKIDSKLKTPETMDALEPNLVVMEGNKQVITDIRVPTVLDLVIGNAEGVSRVAVKLWRVNIPQAVFTIRGEIMSLAKFLGDEEYRGFLAVILCRPEMSGHLPEMRGLEQALGLSMRYGLRLAVVGEYVTDTELSSEEYSDKLSDEITMTLGKMLERSRSSKNH